MTIETIMEYIADYSYIVIIVLLFFGIVGIPAPEESLLFLVGILIGYKQLNWFAATTGSALGVFVGMIVAYGIGRKIGEPFIRRYGKYVGLNEKNWNSVTKGYNRNAFRTIVFGLYMPGIRQLSPYFAGMVKVPFYQYCICVGFGTVIWTVPYIFGGYYLGTTFQISPNYAPYIGFIIFGIFILYVILKKYIKKK